MALYSYMRYLGGKYYVAKHIANHINGHGGTVYLEPFMGSCWVTAQAEYKHRIAGDYHDHLVELYHKVTHEGYEPPEFISKEEYDDIRAHRRDGKYPPELVAFAGFGSAFGGSYFRKYAGEIYAGRSRRSILRKAQQLQGTQFFVADYKELNPKGCVIYCDPPYEDCYIFRVTNVVGNPVFDSKTFWEVADRWAEHNLVFVSELDAPKGWECVMDVPVPASVRTKEGCSIRHEKLFHKNRGVELVREDVIDPIHILGVPADWKGLKR